MSLVPLESRAAARSGAAVGSRVAALFLGIACSGFGLVGCDGGSPEPPEAGVCGPCAAGHACDSESGVCVRAMVEGEVCDRLPDGGVPDGVCEAGLVCGRVGGASSRCSRNCASFFADVCGHGRQCFARPDGSGRGFCGALAAEGEDCDSAALTFCGSGLTCITPSAGMTDGRCFLLCAPGSGACGAGRSCADPFLDEPTRGFCVVPSGPAPARCDYSSLLFCAEGEACVRPSQEGWGYCHRRCAGDSDCVGEQCVRTVSGSAFCASPVRRCPPETAPSSCEQCQATADRFCATGDLCVQLPGATVCKQDCTGDPEGCPAATTCVPLSGSSRSACL